MKIKTPELTGHAINWAVMTCEGYVQPNPITWILGSHFTPSTNWSQGGPIIEREICEIIKGGEPTYWEARAGFDGEPGHAVATGPTPLIAAMRCYCYAKLGDEIDIPEELCQQQSS